MVSRREFLASSSFIPVAPSFPWFLTETIGATAPLSDQRVLVVVQLDGGNDGLNTVIPYENDTYHKLRPGLRIRDAQRHRIAEGVALHPAMAGLRELFDQQRLGIIQGTGYPNPNRSHDVSMAIWHTARFDEEEHNSTGWLGDALDPAADHPRDAPDSVFIGDTQHPVALRGRRCVSSAMDSLEELISAAELSPLELSATSESELTRFLHQSSQEAWAMVQQLLECRGRHRSSGIEWPASELSRRLQLISQLIQADLGTRVFYVVQSGYDTHSQQAGQHARLLRNLSRGLKAFSDELSAAGLEDRVLTLCFSEFGRQVEQNASEGTDHGTAGPVLLMGSCLNGGLHGQAPNLDALTNNAPEHTTDFRSVYATVLRDWMGIAVPPSCGEAANSLELFSGTATSV